MLDGLPNPSINSDETIMKEWKTILTALRMKKYISVLLDPKSDEDIEKIVEIVKRKLKKLGQIKSRSIIVENNVKDEFWSEEIKDFWQQIRGKKPEDKMRELLTFSKQKPFLPQSIDEWLIWSGQLDGVLNELESRAHLKSIGDEGRFAGLFLEKILPQLRVNQRWLLEKNGEGGTPKNLYQVYQRLGEGGIQVINHILSVFETKIQPTRRPEQIQRKGKSGRRSQSIPGQLPLFTTKIPVEQESRAPSLLVRGELRQRTIVVLNPTIPEKIRVGIRFFGDKYGDRYTFMGDDFILNGFGSLSFSAHFLSSSFYGENQQTLMKYLNALNNSEVCEK